MFYVLPPLALAVKDDSRTRRQASEKSETVLDWATRLLCLIISIWWGPCSCLIHCGAPFGDAAYWCGSPAGWCRALNAVNGVRQRWITVALVPLPGRVWPTQSRQETRIGKALLGLILRGLLGTLREKRLPAPSRSAAARACNLPDGNRRAAGGDYLGRRIHPDGAVVIVLGHI